MEARRHVRGRAGRGGEDRVAARRAGQRRHAGAAAAPCTLHWRMLACSCCAPLPHLHGGDLLGALLVQLDVKPGGRRGKGQLVWMEGQRQHLTAGAMRGAVAPSATRAGVQGMRRVARI